MRISGKAIRLRLPLPQVTDADLDHRADPVIDHTTGLMREFDKGPRTDRAANSLGDIERAARREGILGGREGKAQLQLALFLHQAGYENIEFVDGNPGITTPPVREGASKF